jgi:Family of unknown function (DUF5662)
MPRADKFLFRMNETVGVSTVETRIVNNSVELVYDDVKLGKLYHPAIQLAAEKLNSLFEENYEFLVSSHFEGNRLITGVVCQSVSNEEWPEKFYKYLEYLLKHKWYVFVECYKLGILEQGIIHDASKYDAEEWFAYADNFFGNEEEKKAAKKPFSFAWLNHIHHNPHHWNYWILNGDNGDVDVLPMPGMYVLEMIADWTGAGIAITGSNDLQGWYRKNEDKMTLHPDTRKKVESMVFGKV